MNRNSLAYAFLILYTPIGPNATAQTTQKILSSIPFGYFFQVLQQDHGYDTEQIIDRTCHVLELLLKDQPYSTLVQDEFLVAALGQALDSPSPRVRALGLSQVDKVSEEDLSVLRTLVSTLPFRFTEIEAVKYDVAWDADKQVAFH